MNLRLVHVAFFVSWFLFIFVIETAQPTRIANASMIIPAALYARNSLERPKLSCEQNLKIRQQS